MPGATRINPQSHDLTIGSIDRCKKIIRFTELLAEFHGDGKKRQGTTLVVPLVQQEDVGL
jgi:hypothetical protein